MKWIRTCQECGYEQECPKPSFDKKGDLTIAYSERKCKKCKSSGSLDYGSEQPSTSEEKAAALKYLESEE